MKIFVIFFQLIFSYILLRTIYLLCPVWMKIIIDIICSFCMKILGFTPKNKNIDDYITINVNRKNIKNTNENNNFINREYYSIGKEYNELKRLVKTRQLNIKKYTDTK